MTSVTLSPMSGGDRQHLRFPARLPLWEDLFCLGWKVLDQSEERLTRLFQNAKDHPQGHVARRLSDVYLTSIGREFDKIAKLPTLVVPVPTSQETIMTKNSLQYRLASRLCSSYGYDLGASHVGQGASRERLSSGNYSIAQRQKIVSGMTWSSIDKSYERVIVVDDFLTTGTTVGQLLRLICDAQPTVKFRAVVVLGKCERFAHNPSAHNRHLKEEDFWAKYNSKGFFR